MPRQQRGAKERLSAQGAVEARPRAYTHTASVSARSPGVTRPARPVSGRRGCGKTSAVPVHRDDHEVREALRAGPPGGAGPVRAALHGACLPPRAGGASCPPSGGEPRGPMFDCPPRRTAAQHPGRRVATLQQPCSRPVAAGHRREGRPGTRNAEKRVSTGPGPSAAAPGAPTPGAPRTRCLWHAICTGCRRALAWGARSPGGVPAARVVGPLLVGGSQCPVKAPCTGLTPARHHPLPASPQPLKQYLKALVVSAADGTALQGDDSGETSSGGEGYTSGGLLDTSAPSLAFKPTSRQVADFQQRLKGASRLAGRVAGRPV